MTTISFDPARSVAPSRAILPLPAVHDFTSVAALPMPHESLPLGCQYSTTAPVVLADLVWGGDVEAIRVHPRPKRTRRTSSSNAEYSRRMEATYDDMARERLEAEGAAAKALLRANMLRRARSGR